MYEYGCLDLTRGSAWTAPEKKIIEIEKAFFKGICDVLLLSCWQFPCNAAFLFDDGLILQSLLVYSFTMDKEGTATAFVRKPRSAIWEHFTRSGDTAKCRHCTKEYKYFSSTTNLQAHMKSAHPKMCQATESPSSTGAGGVTKMGTLPISSWSGGKVSTCSVKRSQEITGLVADWVFGSCRPLSIVNDPELATLLENLQPGYQLPSRTHLSKILTKHHQAGSEELISLLERAPAVALTSDCWTSRATQSYATYTVHFVDQSKDKWSLESFMLQTAVFSGSHTADNLATHARNTCSKFKLPAGKVVGLVHDEAANMMAAGRQLEEGEGWANVACGAHRIQTVVRHAVGEVREVETLLAASRRLVSHFHHSSKSTEELLKEQSGPSPLKSVQDGPTRWNSSYYMLDRLLKLKLAVTAVLDRSEKRDIRQLNLKDHQWELAIDIVRLLAPFEQVTDVLGGEKYVASSLLLPLVHKLEKKCNAGQEDESRAAFRFRKALARSLRQKFDVSSEKSLVLSALLDPRFRSLKFLSDEDQAEAKISILQLCTTVVADRSEAPVVVADEPSAKRRICSSKLASLMEDDEVEVADSASSLAEEELQRYLTGKASPIDMDPLVWWTGLAEEFPTLAVLARHYLCLPATSVPSERVFSCAGTTMNKLRATLCPGNVDALIFLQCNALKSTRSQLPDARPMAESAYDKTTVLPDELPALPQLEE